ncbi:proton-conducting transporter membrane subunit [Thermoplasmatota archaeon]
MSFIDFLLQHSPALIVAIPLLGAFLTPLISKINNKVRNVFVILIILITTILVMLLASDVFSGNIHTYVFGSQDLTVPLVRILFEVDAMSAFMAIVGSILLLVSVIYSWSFIDENPGLDKYYTLVLLLAAGMFGMMLTGDMFNFFVFLEITSIASCALIAFWTNKGKAVEAAFKYIVISSLAALFILFSIALLYGQYNALNIAVLGSVIQFSYLDKIALVLLIAALAMKAGIVPMHMWLPDAYGRAPASVTIILIGATQASLYGVFRVCFTLYGNTINLSSASIGWIIVLLGLITMLIGVAMALIQSNFKRLIAFSAVAEIGFIFLGIGTGLTLFANNQMFGLIGTTAMSGGIFHIINDSLDVGLLFLVAGAVYYATKETSLDKMGGLARHMKYTTIFFIIGLLAISGIPPMNGFASKLLIYESTFQLNPILSIVAILSSIMLLAVFVKVFHSAFLGPALPKFNGVKEVPKTMLFAMGIIASIIIIFGLFPYLVINNIVDPAVNALINYSDYIREVIPTFSGGF